MSDNAESTHDQAEQPQEKKGPVLATLLGAGLKVPQKVNNLEVGLREWTNGEFAFYESILERFKIDEVLHEYTDKAQEAQSVLANAQSAVEIAESRLRAKEIAAAKLEVLMTGDKAGESLIDKYLQATEDVAVAIENLAAARQNARAQTTKILGTTFIGGAVEDKSIKSALIMCYLLGTESVFRAWETIVKFNEQGDLVGNTELLQYINSATSADNAAALEVVNVGKGLRRRQISDLLDQAMGKISGQNGMITSIS